MLKFTIYIAMFTFFYLFLHPFILYIFTGWLAFETKKNTCVLVLETILKTEYRW